MKYIYRTLWLIGYVLVSIFESACFLIMLFTYPLVGAFYFIKTGDCDDIPFTPVSLPIYVDKKYRELLNYL